MKFFITSISSTVFVLLFSLTICPAMAIGGSGGADMVSRLEKRYRSITTLKADFSQVSKGLASMDGTSGGRVYFKKPARIRWVYKGTVQDEIIGDGNVLWFYQPDLNQAFKSAGKRPGITTDFLSGMGSIRKYFIASVEPADKGLVSIKLEPRQSDPQIKGLILVVEVKTLLVKKFILTDHYGNTTEVSFSHIKINAPMGDELFAFSPPKGTAVIEQQGQAR